MDNSMLLFLRLVVVAYSYLNFGKTQAFTVVCW